MFIVTKKDSTIVNSQHKDNGYFIPKILFLCFFFKDFWCTNPINILIWYRIPRTPLQEFLIFTGFDAQS